MPQDNQRLKVLQFITPSGYYGAERWVVALARNILADEVRCDLVLPTGHDADCQELIDNYPSDKGEIFRIETSSRFDWAFVGKLASLIKERQIDILHTHGYKSDILGILAARRAGVQCISTPHGFGENLELKMKLFVKASILALRFHNRVVPLSPDLLQEMQRRGVPEKLLRYIPNGVDTTEISAYRSAARKAASSVSTVTSEDSFNIGYLGRLADGKGVAEIIDIFDRVWKKNPAAKLYLVGDGPLRDMLDRQLETLACKDNVIFTGFQDDRFRYLSKFDVFVMASVSEGIPRSMMEAMVFEVAVVAFDIPGVDQLVKHGQTGMLAPLGDKQAFADNLNKLIADPDLRRRLAAAGKAHVEQTHSAQSMAESYTQLFRELCR